MPRIRLDHQTISGMKAPEKPTEYYDSHEKSTGLILRLSKAGTKTFAYRYDVGDKKKRITLGKFPGLSLSAAREKVQKLKVDINDGKDPQAEKVKRKREREVRPITLKEVIDHYKEKHLPRLKQSTQADYKNRIKHILKGEGSKSKTQKRGLDPAQPIKDIKRYQVIDFLESIATTAPVQAQRLQAILSGVFKFALNRGWVDKNLASNINLAGKRKNRRKKWQNKAFEDDEIEMLWFAFNGYSEPTGSLLKMLLILGQRAGETRKMKWSDIDPKKQIWRIPATDTKNGLEHDVPLNQLAFNVLDDMKDLNGDKSYVFASPVSKDDPIGHFQKAAQRIRERNEILKDFNIHSLRTTVATQLAQLGTPPQVLSKILNHKKPGEGSIITAIYNKYDYDEEKKSALQNWSNKLISIIQNGNKKANIIKMA